MSLVNVFVYCFFLYHYKLQYAVIILKFKFLTSKNWDRGIYVNHVQVLIDSCNLLIDWIGHSHGNFSIACLHYEMYIIFNLYSIKVFMSAVLSFGSNFLKFPAYYILIFFFICCKHVCECLAAQIYNIWLWLNFFLSLSSCGLQVELNKNKIYITSKFQF